jgi:hypothetical protein
LIEKALDIRFDFKGYLASNKGSVSIFWFPGERLRGGKSIIAHNALGVPVAAARPML